MSSNINLVDKLNPMYLEHNNKSEIKIDPKEIERIRKEIIENIENKNKNKNKDNKNGSKVTISYSETEKNLIKLEELYNKYLSQLEAVEKKVIEQKKQNNEINTNKINELDTENSLKKKLLLNPLLKPLMKPILNQLFNLF